MPQVISSLPSPAAKHNQHLLLCRYSATLVHTSEISPTGLAVVASELMADADIRSPRRRGMSLGTKLSLGLTFMIVILFAGANSFNVLTSLRRQRSEALIHNETVARLVLGALTPELSLYDIHSNTIRTFIGNFLTAALTLNKKNRDLAYVVVVDGSGAVIAGKAKLDITVFPGRGRMTDEALALAEIARLQGRLGGTMRVVPASLVSNGSKVGRIFVGTSLARITHEAQQSLLINLGAFAISVVLLIFYSSITLRRMVVNPLRKVVSAMHDVQHGRLDTKLELRRRDEIGELADTYDFMVRGLKDRAKLQDAFNRYVSKQVYEKMQTGQITLTGEMRNATILFSDIRSFTSLSERLQPPQVVRLLNEYFTEMVEIIFKYDGFLNKFIGDAIMAVYNVPIDQTHPELRAVRTALEMVDALAQLNLRRAERGQFAIKIGIGINTGPVVAGNLGHEQRLEYTVIGDAVNLAQRLESQTKVAGTPILISEATYLPCAPYIDATALPPVKVKGKQENVVLYAVRGLKGAMQATQVSSTAAASVAAARLLRQR